MTELKERLTGGKLKGGILRARLAWLTTHHGETGLEAVKGRLCPEHLAVLSGPVLATQWYDFELLVNLDRAIAEVIGGDPEALFIELGRHSAQLNLTTTYKAFTKDGPHAFLSREADFHAKLLDFGEARYEKLGERDGRLVRFAYRCYCRVFCLSALGYYERVLTLHGAEQPVVEEVRCTCRGDASCTYTLRW